jgi:thiamine-phosphate pyrophosphorylase
MLVSPPVEDPADFSLVVAEILAAADIAAVVLRLAAASRRGMIERIKAIAPLVQDHDAALLLDGQAELVVPSGADGAHLTGIAALQAAIGSLQPASIAGAGGLRTRHDAMLAGEAGADYVMFGEPDEGGRRPAFAAVLERVAWWAEVFQPPCVGSAGNLDEVAPLAAAGADFVALGDWLWSATEEPAAAVARAAALLRQEVPAL